MSEQTTIEFKTSAQQICYEKAALWLQQIFGEMTVPFPESPRFIVFGTSTFTNVYVYPWNNDDATVCVRSYIRPLA